MPELPEVETLRRALLPLVKGQTLQSIKFFRDDIRFPIPKKNLRQFAQGQSIRNISRRGKYLLLEVTDGAILLHLGMSGRVAQFPSARRVEKHTHVIFHLTPDLFLHFIDPRRFGAVLWFSNETGHPLIDSLGLEPLAPTTTADKLKQAAGKSTASIKSFLMNAKKLVGVGNIYACESLFKAKINPKRPAGKLSMKDWERLLAALRKILDQSIASGGTTLRDFFDADGRPGYYALNLCVYGREGKPCPSCGSPVSKIVQTGRSTFFCKVCQNR